MSRLRSVKARYACQAPSICVKARDACQAPSICVKARDACQAPSICVKARDAGQAPGICVKARDAGQAPSICVKVSSTAREAVKVRCFWLFCLVCSSWSSRLNRPSLSTVLSHMLLHLVLGDGHVAVEGHLVSTYWQLSWSGSK